MKWTEDIDHETPGAGDPSIVDEDHAFVCGMVARILDDEAPLRGAGVEPVVSERNYTNQMLLPMLGGKTYRVTITKEDDEGA